MNMVSASAIANASEWSWLLLLLLLRRLLLKMNYDCVFIGWVSVAFVRAIVISFHPSWSIEAFVLQQIKWWLMVYHHHHHLKTEVKYSKKRIFFSTYLCMVRTTEQQRVICLTLNFESHFIFNSENKMYRLL